MALRVHERHGALETSLPRVPRISLAPTRGFVDLCYPANCFRRHLSILGSISGSLMLRLVGCSQTAALDGFAVDRGLTSRPLTKMRATSHHAHNFVAHLNKTLNSFERKSFAYLQVYVPGRRRPRVLCVRVGSACLPWEGQ